MDYKQRNNETQVVMALRSAGKSYRQIEQITGFSKCKIGTIIHSTLHHQNVIAGENHDLQSVIINQEKTIQILMEHIQLLKSLR